MKLTETHFKNSTSLYNERKRSKIDEMSLRSWSYRDRDVCIIKHIEVLWFDKVLN